MRYISIATALSASLFCVFCPRSLADNTAIVIFSQPGVLRAIKEISVNVEPLPRQAEEAGLVRQQLEADVEARFRDAGVTVLEPEVAYERDPQPPELNVSVSCVKIQDGARYAVSTLLQEKENVTPLRDPNLIIVHAPTWQQSSLSVVAEGQFRENVTNGLRDRVDSFLKDYLKVNPK